MRNYVIYRAPTIDPDLGSNHDADVMLFVVDLAVNFDAVNPIHCWRALYYVITQMAYWWSISSLYKINQVSSTDFCVSEENAYFYNTQRAGMSSS